MPKRPIVPEDLLRLHFVGDPQIHPDGTQILFTKKHVGEKNRYITNLWSVDLEGALHQWTSGGKDGHGRWSPDGQTIAFISGRSEPTAQIFLISTGGGEARPLTRLPEGSLGEFKWSPDGRTIAFTFRQLDEKWTEASKKAREEAGLSTPPRTIETALYRYDGDGYFDNDRYRIYVVDVATGDHRVVYDRCPWGQYQFDWAPNSKELVVVRSVAKNIFAERADERLFRIDLTGQEWAIEGVTGGAKSTVSWSPDGRHIAYVGYREDADDWGAGNARLYLTPADGGTTRCLTENDDYCFTTSTLSDTREASFEASLAWSPDGQAIYFGIGRHGESQIAYSPIEEGGVHFLTSGKHTVTFGNVSRDGDRFGCLVGTATAPAEVAVYDLSEGGEAPRILTHLNREWRDEVKIVEPEEVWIDSTDGTKVHAWIMQPADFLPPKRYPAVLEIHGGPHAQYGWAFFHEFQVLAAAGYVVVYSNPRGSKGYGEAHCRAISGKWGDKDWDDIQEVTRWMQHLPYVHPGRMGVMGGSYGGYMTNWVVGHTKDFRAAITDRCVASLLSLSLNSDFISRPDGYWPGCAFGSHERMAELWKQSPISCFEGVTTPMLIIHSEGDLRCNVEQSEQVFAALQIQGVESRYVRYPSNTSHGMSRSGPPDLRLHRLGEILAWWGRHLQA